MYQTSKRRLGEGETLTIPITRAGVLQPWFRVVGTVTQVVTKGDAIEVFHVRTQQTTIVFNISPSSEIVSPAQLPDYYVRSVVRRGARVWVFGEFRVVQPFLYYNVWFVCTASSRRDRVSDSLRSLAVRAVASAKLLWAVCGPVLERG